MKLVALRARRWRWARSWSRTLAAWRLRLKRTYIDATIEHAIEMTASLVVERRRSEVRIAGVNRRAARQQCVRKGWAAVILQRTKQRIGVDLIAWASQIAAAVIAAEIVSIDVTVPPLLKMFSPNAPAFRIVLEISTDPTL